MNPTKSFLGVSSKNFLGFIITLKGIHLDPEKTRAIIEMKLPRNLKKLKGFHGSLVYIWKFISNLSGWFLLLNKLIKKGVSFIYDLACQEVI